MYLMGYDVGSSSVKATVLDAETGAVVASATSPKTELEISAPRAGWAEQRPETWWQHIKAATAEIAGQGCRLEEVGAIGISYQMHGLVVVDKNYEVLRPSIIWCDSRAVEIGQKAFEAIGAEKCLGHLLNSPGNFTASKLKWVKDNEPDIFAKIHKAMLPGDYVAGKMTGQFVTTASGLSEGMLWDFQANAPAEMVTQYYGIPNEMLCDVKDTFGVQGELTAEAAAELGLKAGTPVTYRAGDQPNNALSLNVLNPGEIAATAGTSGVVYGVTDKTDSDPQSRVNIFAHVNHSASANRCGVLLCVSGTGILNSWLKHNVMADGDDYPEMNAMAEKVAVGADGLVVLPFGNGAERTLGDKNIGAAVEGLNFNTHNRGHLLRAAQEGIVFALNYGCEVMRSINVEIKTVRAGHANMFLSPLFAKAFATVTGARVELFNTDGSQGAARGAGIGAGIYKSAAEAFDGLKCVKTIEPDSSQADAYAAAYDRWLAALRRRLG
ncbi:MAG: carbohydrate kinase [Sedimentisphaerales bacterium]|nr:carbohydrate kinase [Sedimentisphaerales bacterium]